MFKYKTNLKYHAAKANNKELYEELSYLFLFNNRSSINHNKLKHKSLKRKKSHNFIESDSNQQFESSDE